VNLDKQDAGPLKGLLVLDLTRAVAGPFCTLMLGDLGARVIKVEEAEGGDETRHWGPPFVSGESAYFLALNRNKESVLLDLKEESGLAALHHLANAADVLVQNFRPGVMEKLGIGYATLKPANPRLVFASISGFGLTGPDRSRPGYDLIVQAMAGVLLANGASSSGVADPVKTCFPIADILAGQFASQAILAALLERQTTGQGNHIEVSLLEALLASMPNLSSSALTAKQDSIPNGPIHSSIVPYQVLKCRDAPVAVAVPNNRIWKRFCAALGQPHWREDERYSINQARHENRAELMAGIERVTMQKDAAEWLEIFDRHHIPSGPLLSVAQAFDHPQVLDREAVVTIEHPQLGPLRMVANPMRFEGRSTQYKHPPRLGENTEDILEEFCPSEVSASQKQ